jgi:hydroxyethylthiazole kinase
VSTNNLPANPNQSEITTNVIQLLHKVRSEKPLVHHITNWVTIYDCAQIVKSFGASPVMAHAREEVADMINLASALVLNIGTLTPEVIEAMLLAGSAANKKGIPIVLDVCGAGATPYRDKTCEQLLGLLKISIIKGNASEIARVAGENIRTKGVDASPEALAELNAQGKEQTLTDIAQRLAQARQCTVVVTGADDIVADAGRVFRVKNGHELMTHVVGTGCMAASVLGTFAAVTKDPVMAAVSALACYEIAAEKAIEQTTGPMDFKQKLFDEVYLLNQISVSNKIKVTCERILFYN